MSKQRTGRARRVEPATDIDPEDILADHDYVSSFAVEVPDAGATSAEEWARATLEGAPRLLRWFVVFGWKVVLRLRLEPSGEAGNVAGWRIVRSRPDLLTLEVRSSLVTARKVMQVHQDRLVLTTTVSFEGRAGRILWSTIAPIHHLVEPLLLSLAVARVTRG